MKASYGGSFEFYHFRGLIYLLAAVVQPTRSTYGPECHKAATTEEVRLQHARLAA